MFFTYNPENTRTPIQNAYSTYRKLRRRGYRRLSHHDRMRYMFGRQYRSAAKQWHNGQRECLIHCMKQSAAETAKWVAKWEAFLQWMEDEVKVNPERFEAVRGHSTEGTTSVMDGKGTVNNDAIYDSDVRAYKHFYGRVSSLVEEISDHYYQAIDTDGLDDLDEGEVLMANLIEEIEMGAAGLGLEPHPVFEPGADGAVWFVDPETNHEFFLLLQTVCNFTKGDVATFFLPVTHLGDKWKRTSMMELSHYGLAINSRTRGDNPARAFKDQFGYFNSNLRMYMEAAGDAPVDWDWD